VSNSIFGYEDVIVTVYLVMLGLHGRSDPSAHRNLSPFSLTSCSSRSIVSGASVYVNVYVNVDGNVYGRFV
jgi:hypothetical protein